MFSRVGRLTTFGAQAVSNCPFRRDNIYQQPLKVTAPINDQLVNFAHNFSDSLRPRTTSFGNDPFLGVPMDDEEVIKELELLDLDSWHTKPRPPCPAPSDELELDQFWEGKNVTVCGRDPRTGHSTCHFELEAWRPTDTWNAPQQPQSSSHPQHPQHPPQQQQQQHQHPQHSNCTEMMHDFSNFGDNMGAPIFRSPSKSSLDQSNIFASSSSRPDEFQFGTGNAHNQPFKAPKFEVDVENASKTVDWDAWNHYLESDDEIGNLKRPEAFFMNTEDNESATSSGFHSMTSSSVTSPESISLLDVIPPTPLPQLHFQQHPLMSTSSSANLFRISTSSGLTTSNVNSASAPRLLHQDVDLFSSGPLICVPKEEELDTFDDAPSFEMDKDDEDYIPSAGFRKSSSRPVRKTVASLRRREESERSWTPASDDYYGEENTQKFKKRGVVLKPSVDEETDRRRALNRIAAVRYREKKRAEKMGRKREFQDVADRNRILVQKERQLKREIAAMKKELRKMGAILH